MASCRTFRPLQKTALFHPAIKTSSSAQRLWQRPAISPSLENRSTNYVCQKRWNSVSQKPGSDRVHFPGAVNSRFTTKLSFNKATEDDAMPTFRILDQEGSVIDESQPVPETSEEELLKLYKDMVFVSVMDIIMFDAQRQGRISFYMVSAGEEGIAVGSASALSNSDPIFAQYRETGAFQWRGFTPDDFMAQLFATKNDSGMARNMPVHYGSRKFNVHAISSTLATQLPHAAGSAYALKLHAQLNPTEERRVAACYFGEGAASEGDFHAALNIAAVRACPVIFICRNNGYAISTPTLDQYRGDGIASRGIGYGVDTIRVDGNDVLAVREVVRRARELALSDSCKPVLIEAMSYRVSHHSTSDDSFAYRAKVEVEEWKRRDNPITRLRKYLENKGIWNEDKEKQLRSDCRRDVLTAYRKAEKEQHPRLGSMMEDVWAEPTEQQIEQMAQLRDVMERYPDEYDTSSFKDGMEGLKIKNR